MQNREKSDSLPLIALIDIGSNRIRLDVCRQNGDKLEDVLTHGITCKLGKSVGEQGVISEKAQDNAVAALMEYKSLLEEYGVDYHEVVGTAPFRDSSNADDFIKLIKEQTGFEVNVLSGKKEAEYIARGVLAHYYSYEDVSGTVVHIGGGSLDMALIKKGEVMARSSRPSGAFPVQAAKNSQSFLDKQTSKMPPDLFDSKTLYLSGAVAKHIGKLYAAQNEGVELLYGDEDSPILLSDFCEYSNGLGHMPEDLLKDKYNMKSRHAPLVQPVSLILDHLNKHGNFKRVVLTDVTIRDGLLHEMHKTRLAQQLSPQTENRDVTEKPDLYYAA